MGTKFHACRRWLKFTQRARQLGDQQYVETRRRTTQNCLWQARLCLCKTSCEFESFFLFACLLLYYPMISTSMLFSSSSLTEIRSISARLPRGTVRSLINGDIYCLLSELSLGPDLPASRATTPHTSPLSSPSRLVKISVASSLIKAARVASSTVRESSVFAAKLVNTLPAQAQARQCWISSSWSTVPGQSPERREEGV